MSINQFLRGKENEKFSVKVDRHFKKYGFIYKIVGSTAIILISGGALDYAFASNVNDAVSAGIDREARGLYRELVNIGKWFIIFKGGIEVIKSVGNGDVDTAKKSFFSHLMTYLFLLALPYGLDKVDGIFTKATIGR